ncbi:MAG: RNA polymerase sigma factor FliA [Thioalkalispiraceae bacterium]|jgi:RNA polymerase sigma factor for flagellar operon FliA
MYSQIDNNQQAEQIINKHSDLVHRIAYHLSARLPASVVIDDLIQVGMIGLLDASQNYDPSQGAQFETYATIRVRGAMLDELRRNDWAPKSVHRKARDLMNAIHKIEARKGYDAEPIEIANELGISLDEYHDTLLETNTCRILSFVDLSSDGNFDDETLDSGSSTPLQHMQKEEFQRHLAEAIDELPEREKLVINLYYDEEFNLREIGEILGVSESRISQLMGQAHLRIRGMLLDD